MAALTGGLRVGSWNVREGLPDGTDDPAGRVTAMADLAAALAAYPVDVLALQEVDFDPSGASAVLDALRAHTPLRHVYAEPVSPSAYLAGHAAGVGIASRVPVVEHGLELMPNPGLRLQWRGEAVYSFEKGMIAGAVELAGLRVTVTSVHLFPFRRFGRTPEEPEFAPIWRDLADQLGKFADEPLVVCGDFNTPRRDLLLRAADRPLSRAVGERPTHRGLPIDDILYSADFAEVATPDVVRTFSDHDLCVAHLAPA